MESEDYSLPDPARNNVWVRVPPGTQASELADRVGPLFFPNKTKRERNWTVHRHTCM